MSEIVKRSLQGYTTTINNLQDAGDPFAITSQKEREDLARLIEKEKAKASSKHNKRKPGTNP